MARLEGTSALVSDCNQAVTATTWPDRERALSAAFEALARLHNELALTEPIDGRVRHFYSRPYQVIEAGRFAAALAESVKDDRVRRLPLIGAIDQFIDNTDAIAKRTLRRAAAQSYAGRHDSTVRFYGHY